MPHLDELARITTDPGTPRDERYDANAELYRDFISQLDYPDLDEIRADIASLLANEQLMSKAALRLDQQWVRGRPPAGHPREHTAILYLNEYGLVDPTGSYQSRWLERRGLSGFEFLRDVEHSVDLIAAIKLTRQRQIEPFLRPERDEGPLGFRIERADGEKPTRRDQGEMKRIEQMLLCGGDEPSYFDRLRLRRPDLASFGKQLVGDSLIADACPVELTYTRARELSGWHNLDFATIRLTSEQGYEGDDEIRAVQVWDGTPRVAFGYRDILYEVRNPRTDLAAGGYGLAESEIVIRAITAYLNAVTFNMAGIDRSSMPRGILQLTGKYDQKNLSAFQRQFKAMLSGAANRHHIPIIASDGDGGVNWMPVDTFDEMFFARWATFLVSIVCAVYGIDPTEIHFDSFSVRPSSLSGSDTAEKLSLSRDKGLVPLLAFVERILNILVTIINPRYRFKFVGLHEEDASRKQDRIKLSSTVDELRNMDGQEPHPNPLIGAAPVNSVHMQLYMASLQQAAAEDDTRKTDAGEQSSGETGEQPGQDAPAQATAAVDSDGAETNGAGGQVDLAFAKARTVGDFLVVLEHDSA